METALKLGDGVIIAASGVVDAAGERADCMFSEKYACPTCGISLPEIEPRTFSFNSPHGACPACTGLGTQARAGPAT